MGRERVKPKSGPPGGGGARGRPQPAARPPAIVRPKPKPATFDPPGLAARRLATIAVEDVIVRRQPLDDSLDRLLSGPDARLLEERDRALTRAIAVVAIRRLGTIRKALAEFMKRGMPAKSGRLEAILVAAAAQILLLDVPDHAAVDSAVRLARGDRDSAGYSALANAVLRNLARAKAVILAVADPLAEDTPDWLSERWIAAYGEATARAIAAAHRAEPAVDLTPKGDPKPWVKRLDALLLPTGSLRLRGRTPIAQLPGYAEGAWWVQDAAAALPARLLGAREGWRVADLCAAPGGKTAQLAVTGAEVVAVDRSAPRLARLDANMRRLGLDVRVVEADVLAFDEPAFDAVLLDAPCTATGTIRRHPDVPWTKGPGDLAKLAGLQARLLDRAADLVRPGGRLVYCVCSLEPEEGEAQAAAFLARRPDFARLPVQPEEIGGLADLIGSDGGLRTLPVHLPHAEPRLSGLDGFYAARLVRRA